MSKEPIYVHVGDKTKPKNRKNVDLAVPVKFILGIMGLIVTLFFGAVYGLWRLAEHATHTQLTIVGIVFFFLIPIALLLGYWFGRTEVRGFLSGMDTAVDRIAKAIDLRDGTKRSLQPRIQSHDYRTYQDAQSVPDEIMIRNMPQLTFRESHRDQVIDL